MPTPAYLWSTTDRPPIAFMLALGTVNELNDVGYDDRTTALSQSASAMGSWDCTPKSAIATITACIDMGAATVISGWQATGKAVQTTTVIAICLGSTTTINAGSIDVEYSLDGTDGSWTSVYSSALSSSYTKVSGSTPFTARYVRVVVKSILDYDKLGDGTLKAESFLSDFRILSAVAKGSIAFDGFARWTAVGSGSIAFNGFAIWKPMAKGSVAFNGFARWQPTAKGNISFDGAARWYPTLIGEMYFTGVAVADVLDSPALTVETICQTGVDIVTWTAVPKATYYILRDYCMSVLYQGPLRSYVHRRTQAQGLPYYVSAANTHIESPLVSAVSGVCVPGAPPPAENWKHVSENHPGKWSEVPKWKP